MRVRMSTIVVPEQTEEELDEEAERKRMIEIEQEEMLEAEEAGDDPNTPPIRKPVRLDSSPTSLTHALGSLTRIWVHHIVS